MDYYEEYDLYPLPHTISPCIALVLPLSGNGPDQSVLFDESVRFWV